MSKSKSVQDLHPDSNKGNKGEIMDTKNLLKKGNRWYLNFTFPAKFAVEKLAGRKIRISLETSDYKLAHNIRDSYISNIISANSKLQVVERLAKHLTEADEELKKMVAAKLPSLKIKSLSNKISGVTSLTISELIDKYLLHLKDKTNLKISTRRRYESALDCFRFIIGRNVQASQMDHSNIVSFVDQSKLLPVGYSYNTAKSLADLISKSAGKKTLSLSNIHFIMCTVGGMFKWAVNSELLERSPVKSMKVYLGEVKKKHKVKPSHEQAEGLCSMPSHGFADFEWKYVPLVARYSGMRIGEISQLTAEAMLEKHGVKCISVSGDLKTEGSARIVPIADKLMPAIREILKKHPKGRLFDCADFKKDGLVKYGHGFLKMYNRAAKKVGPFSFHCWRVYANSEMLDGGAAQTDCERILGHKSMNTNAAYVSSDVQRMKKALDSIH